MSKIYHGSFEVVESPEIRQPSRSLDYGSGFYTTTSNISFSHSEVFDRYKIIESIEIQ